MKVRLLLVSTLLTIGSVALARSKPILVEAVNDPVIKQLVIEKVGTEVLRPRAQARFQSVSAECTGATRLSSIGNLPSTGDVRLDLILNLGAKVYELVKENGPLITTTTRTANALPYGVTCWNQLERWSPPRSEVYRVSYKNLYGVTLLDFQFRLVYSYGGRIGNVGRYLSNATLQYKKIDAKWGAVLDANVEIPQVLNIGTRENPVGGMQLTMNWTVTTRPISLRKITDSATFFIAGDGRATTLLD
jgi:hypothetical protein